MKKYTVIVAGGSGSRMGNIVPKQFLELCGKPILMHTIDRFTDFDFSNEIILVLPKEQIEFWKELCVKHKFTKKHTIAIGGKSRFHSVQNGLRLIQEKNNAVVAVHDGVRPFPSFEMLNRCFNAAMEGKNTIPVLPVIESLREKVESGSIAVERAKFISVQTPQTFPIEVLKKAYELPFRDFYTDDASVVEEYGESIFMVDGNRENIKITHPVDLIIGEHYLNQ